MKRILLIVLLIVGVGLTPAPILLRAQEKTLSFYPDLIGPKPSAPERFAAAIASGIGCNADWVRDIQFRDDWHNGVVPIRVHGGIGPGGP